MEKLFLTLLFTILRNIYNIVIDVLFACLSSEGKSFEEEWMGKREGGEERWEKLLDSPIHVIILVGLIYIIFYKYIGSCLFNVIYPSRSLMIFNSDEKVCFIVDDVSMTYQCLVNASALFRTFTRSL